MGDFKNEYRQAMDKLEPDRRLLESLKADMKAAKALPAAPPKPNFFVKYGWAFGSAAACLVVALAVGVMLTLGRSEMASSGGAMLNGAADIAGEPEMTENANYGVNEVRDNDGNDLVENAPSGAAELDGGNGIDYYYSTTAKAEPADDIITDVREPDDEFFSDVEYDLPLLVGGLRSLSYEELDALMMRDRSGSGLIISDFALYDYIEVPKTDVYYLVLRYNYQVFTLPVVAAFEGQSPEDPLISLRLYRDYNDPSAYIDLREILLEDLENYIYPTGYIYNFGDGDVEIFDNDLEKLTPLTDEQFFDLMNKTGRGSLCLRDFLGLDFFNLGYSYNTCTFVCTYTDGAAEREYALITHFPGTEYDTVPDRMVFVRRRSPKELDLLSEYDLLDSFFRD